MRPILVFALSASLAVVLQTTLVHQLPFLPGGPDLILVLCVYLGLHFHTAGAALGAFLMGYLLDAFSGATPGLYAMAMTLVFSVVYLVSQRLWMENPVSNIAAVGLGSAVKIVVVVFFFLSTFGAGQVEWLRLARVLGVEALFAMVFTPLVFSVLSNNLRPARRS